MPASVRAFASACIRLRVYPRASGDTISGDEAALIAPGLSGSRFQPKTRGAASRLPGSGSSTYHVSANLG